MQAENVCNDTWEIEYEISVALCVSLRTFPLSASQLDGDSPTRSTSSVDHRRTKTSVSSSFRPFSPFKLNLKMGRQPLRRLYIIFKSEGTDGVLWTEASVDGDTSDPEARGRLGGGTTDAGEWNPLYSMRFCHVEAVEDKWKKVGYLVTE